MTWVRPSPTPGPPWTFNSHNKKGGEDTRAAEVCGQVQLSACDPGLNPGPDSGRLATEDGYAGKHGPSDPVPPGSGSLQKTPVSPFRVGSHPDPWMCQECLLPPALEAGQCTPCPALPVAAAILCEGLWRRGRQARQQEWGPRLAQFTCSFLFLSSKYLCLSVLDPWALWGPRIPALGPELLV